MSQFKLYVRLLWLRLCGFFRRCRTFVSSRVALRVQRVRTAVFVARSTPETLDEAKEALRRVADDRRCPPDTVTAGAYDGSPALFFKHDRAQEVFVAHTYEKAADKLIHWLREQDGSSTAPTTAKVTKLNRYQRRAWASNKRRDLSAKGRR